MKKIKIPMLRVALVLLLVVVVTAQISTGLSAKYLSKSEGTSTGRVAHFEAGSISVTSQTESALYSSETLTDGHHAFIADAKLTFLENEVKREFTLTMQIKDDTTATFACPNNVYSLEDCGGSKSIAAADLGISSMTLTPGKAYIAYAKEGEELVWHEISGGTEISLSDAPIPVGFGAENYNVKVLYFKSFAGANQADSQVNITFNLRTDQVD